LDLIYGFVMRHTVNPSDCGPKIAGAVTICEGFSVTILPQSRSDKNKVIGDQIGSGSG
jgi:hypothetical protein